MQPALDWIPNKSFNNWVTKFEWRILPFLDLITNENIETFGRLLLPNKKRFLNFKSLSKTLLLIEISFSWIVWVPTDSFN